jgi:hypothetical protein
VSLSFVTILQWNKVLINKSGVTVIYSTTFSHF